MRLDAKVFEEVRAWMYMNARPLELAMWKALFEGGDVEEFIRILGLYRNPDGGFGRALEPDCWTEASSPYQTAHALSLMRAVGSLDIDQPLVSGAIRYYENDHSCGDMWAFCIPENNFAPHAPWWNYSEEQNNIEHAGVSATIAAQILAVADKGSAVYARAMGAAEKLLSGTVGGDMGGEGLCDLALVLSRDYPDRFPGLIDSVKARVDSLIERDPSKWSGYTRRPSDFIDSPDSPFYPGNEEIFEKELEFMLSERANGGVWPITWSWHDDRQLYAREFAISENWWKGIIAIRDSTPARVWNAVTDQ